MTDIPEGFIPHNGGPMPVEANTMVFAAFYDGSITQYSMPASEYIWGNEIIAYKIDTPLEKEIAKPEHYTQGEIECIDAIRSALTEEEFRGFCKGNILKYVWREKHKDQDKGLKKAKAYIDYAIAE